MNKTLAVIYQNEIAAGMSNKRTFNIEKVLFFVCNPGSGIFNPVIESRQACVGNI